MADCRSLIEFLRAFEQHRRRASSSSDPSSPRPRRASLSSSPSSSSRPRGRGRLFPALCDNSPLAVVDALALLASLAALAPQGRRVRHPARDGGVRARPAAGRGRRARARAPGVGDRGQPTGARGGAQEDGTAQRPHRAHLPRAVRVPKGEDGGLGR